MNDFLKDFFSNIERKEKKIVREPIKFENFLKLIQIRPEFYLRDVFQFFYDMVFYYVKPKGKNKNTLKNDSLQEYDFDALFVEDCENPFFADPVFSDRFIELVKTFKKRTLQNHLILFEGPPGSGKSTFLNNLVSKVEDYARSEEGALFK
ncbi:MAG: serine protein kinase PrkA, partial [Candidatus Kapaibacteriota bacterium]